MVLSSQRWSCLCNAGAVFAMMVHQALGTGLLVLGSTPPHQSYMASMQVPSPGSAQGSHMLQQADGSMQAVPRIVIRTNPSAASPSAPEPLQHSPPSQQYPVVLNSRVVRESTPEPPPVDGSSSSYAQWGAPEQQHQHQLPHPQYGMHQYQQQQQQQYQSTAHAQQPQAHTQAYMPNASHTHAPQAQHQQQHQQQPQHLRYASQQPLHQLPQQQQGQSRPGPRSFQELLSASVLCEEYSTASVTHHPASQHTAAAAAAAATRTQQTHQSPSAQPAAIYSSQVVRHPRTSTGSAVDTTQLSHNSGMGAMPTSQHMLLQQTANPSQRQHQQQQQVNGVHPYTMPDRASPSQLLMQTSSAMYPPIQYPQAVGAFPVLPKTASGTLPGHPYHGYCTSQAAGAATTAQQPQQLMTHQQQQQVFQPYLQAQAGPANQALDNSMHGQAPGQVSNLADPRDAHPQMARVQIGGVMYEPLRMPDQPAKPASLAAAAYQDSSGSHFYPSHASFHNGSQQADRNPQQPSAPTKFAHGHPGQTSPVIHTQDVGYASQHRADARMSAQGPGRVPWGSVQGVIPGPAYMPVREAGGSSPTCSAGRSASQQAMSGLLLRYLQIPAVVLHGACHDRKSWHL